VFWVANQQLPVFDLHYLFGYATVALVAVHLAFNLPVAWRYLKRGTKKKKARERSPAVKRGTVGMWLATAAAILLSFFLGTRHGESKLRLEWGNAGPQAALGPVHAIAQYHEYASLSRTGVFTRAPSVDWGAKPEPFKRYPDREHVTLPPPGAWAGSARSLSAALDGPAPPSDLGLTELGGILFHTAGVTLERGGRKLRAAPSSGALFPTEVYVLARGVVGLTPGLYHYDPEAHRLALVDDTLPDAAALGAAHESIATSPATVVLTSIFRRTGFKYRDRAYRYAIADAGHLLENLRVSASEAGWSARPVRRFDEQLAATALGVDGLEEGVIALVSLDRTVSGNMATGDLTFAELPKADQSAIGVTGVVHVATSLRARPQDTSETRILLPSATDSGDRALRTIQRRRSRRRFTSAPVALEALASILHDSVRAPVLSTAIRTSLVVNRVEGLKPGVYRYERAAHALRVIQHGDFVSAAGSAGLSQDVIADAAVVFILSAHRNTLFSLDGARGYRHAFLEAGLVGERIVLGAGARGLGACPVGAFYDDESAELIGVDPAEEWVVHFAGLGVVD
jgi:SagB-type dehydrogenase family enzyme